MISPIFWAVLPSAGCSISGRAFARATELRRGAARAPSKGSGWTCVTSTARSIYVRCSVEEKGDSVGAVGRLRSRSSARPGKVVQMAGPGRGRWWSTAAATWLRVSQRVRCSPAPKPTALLSSRARDEQRTPEVRFATFALRSRCALARFDFDRPRERVKSPRALGCGRWLPHGWSHLRHDPSDQQPLARKARHSARLAGL